MDTHTHPKPHSKRRLWPLLLAAAMTLPACVTFTGVASAGATTSIENVWSFGGGEIAVHAAANGTLEGTVVSATKFAECTHEPGEAIWTEMSLQSDGSYWGLHHWFFEKTGCLKNSEPGPAAFRVFEEADGSKYLLVCLSSPSTAEKKATQPTIAPNGAHTGETYGCIKSALTAPLPPVINSIPSTGTGTGGVSAFRVSLPSNSKCLSTRQFTIHIAEPKYDPFKTIRVTLAGHSIKTSRHGNYIVATVSLKGRPHGTFTIKISAVTVLGSHLSGSRTYHTCSAKPKKHKPAKLKAG